MLKWTGRFSIPDAALRVAALRLFFFTSAREALLLRPIVRAAFRLVVPTLVAIEEKDFLSWLSHYDNPYCFSQGLVPI
jgi:hypothetical protein